MDSTNYQFDQIGYYQIYKESHTELILLLTKEEEIGLLMFVISYTGKHFHLSLMSVGKAKGSSYMQTLD
jgi:hypothetical protein